MTDMHEVLQIDRLYFPVFQFRAVVKIISLEMDTDKKSKLQSSAWVTLQEITESFIRNLLRDAKLLADKEKTNVTGVHFDRAKRSQ